MSICYKGIIAKYYKLKYSKDFYFLNIGCIIQKKIAFLQLMKSTINLAKDIGTARDNRKSPIHDWYRFTAGFSYKLVEEIIAQEELNKEDIIYESFAGCGTTLVTAQRNGIQSIGNEGQELLIDVIKAKLSWNIDEKEIRNLILRIGKGITNKKKVYNYHKLLESLYNESDLYELYFIKDFLKKIKEEKEHLFLKLALTQTLHKVSVHPISVPYITRNKTLINQISAFKSFEITVSKMLNDLQSVKSLINTSQIYLHDSRKKNDNIPDNHCTICITSPPYLNNLDYGEVSKVCSHFYGITDSWNDITEKVRKKLVTGSTTHYSNSEFNFEEWKKSNFYKTNKRVIDSILPSVKKIKAESDKRAGKKRYDILVLYYFEDMFNVLLEIRRVLREGGKAYFVLGDSAPYGTIIRTTKILGRLSKNAGFEKYKIIKLRERGTKWKTLKFRHNIKLSENILILE